MKRRQVCLFGTSADPPTGEGGHVGIVKALVGTGDYDEVRIIPVYSHSFAVSSSMIFSLGNRINDLDSSFRTE
jgi:nicotinic acid mononucleotide adenylyltransferase